MPLVEHPLRRLVQLLAGLALYGFSLSLLVRGALGVNPWSVLYEGLQRHSSLSFGAISAVVGVVVLPAWLPLRQRPTLGTFANVAVLACSSDLGLALIPQDLGLPARIGLLLTGILLNGFSVAVSARPHGAGGRRPGRGLDPRRDRGPRHRPLRLGPEYRYSGPGPVFEECWSP